MIERAFELADSGSIANIDQLVRSLKQEGFESVDAHLRCSPSLHRQLRSKCAAAWAASGNEPVSERRSA